MIKKMMVSLSLCTLALSYGYAEYVPVHIEHAPVGDLKALVVVAIDDVSTQSAKLQSILNMFNIIKKLDGSISELKFVVYGRGITLLQNPTDAQKILIDQLRAFGAQFLVCNITLTANGIDYHTLYKVQEKDIVPSGTVEVIYLQQKKNYSINSMN